MRNPQRQHGRPQASQRQEWSQGREAESNAHTKIIQHSSPCTSLQRHERHTSHELHITCQRHTGIAVLACLKLAFNQKKNKDMLINCGEHAPIRGRTAASRTFFTGLLMQRARLPRSSKDAMTGLTCRVSHSQFTAPTRKNFRFLCTLHRLACQRHRWNQNWKSKTQLSRCNKENSGYPTRGTHLHSVKRKNRCLTQKKDRMQTRSTCVLVP